MATDTAQGGEPLLQRAFLPDGLVGPFWSTGRRPSPARIQPREPATPLAEYGDDGGTQPSRLHIEGGGEQCMRQAQAGEPETLQGFAEKFLSPAVE